MDANEYNQIVERIRRIRHDASSPLTAALGSIQLVLGDPAIEDPEVLEMLREAETELRKLRDLLRELDAIRPAEDDSTAPGAPD